MSDDTEFSLPPGEIDLGFLMPAIDDKLFSIHHMGYMYISQYHRKSTDRYLEALHIGFEKIDERLLIVLYFEDGEKITSLCVLNSKYSDFSASMKNKKYKLEEIHQMIVSYKSMECL